MNRHAAELRSLARQFLSGQASFWNFHEELLDRWTRMPPDTLSEAERAAWNEIYGWVLTSIPDPVSAEDGARGVIGEAELKHRLGRHPLLASPR